MIRNIKHQFHEIIYIPYPSLKNLKNYVLYIKTYGNINIAKIKNLFDKLSMKLFY